MMTGDVKITEWPGLFWVCFWLVFIWGSLNSIRDELKGIREGLGYPEVTTPFISWEETEEAETEGD